MRIVCPSCQAAYEVPDKLLSSGPRKVRCAKCGKDWMAEAEAPEPTAEADAEAPPPPPPAPEALPPEEAEEPPPPAVPVVPVPAAATPEPAAPRADEKLVPEAGERPSRALAVIAGVAWLASIAVLGAAGWAAVAFRADVMATWGASRRLYALLGLG